ETLPFLAADWLRRPVRDAYWRHGSVCEDWSAIQASVLAIGGWADAYVNAPLALAANLRSPRAALIGPWEHKYPHLSRILASDAHGEILGWFDRHLKTREGAPVPPARVFVQEHFATIGGPGAAYAPAAGRWVAEMAWPSPNVAERALHLSRGALGPEPGSGETAIATPLTVGRAAAYFCPGMRVDHELAGDQAEDDAASARFDTEPLAEPLEILGRPVLDIAFRVDRPVAQLVARLCDVTPGGVSQRVSYHALNLCQHAGHDRAEALEPGRLYTARLPLNTCAHRFAAGHRLRLALSTSYWPVIWPSPEAATVTLDLAECRLLLPERRVAEEPEPMAPGPARARPPSDLETVRRATGSSRRYVETDGTEVLETIDDFGASRAIAHGLETGSSVTQRYAIRPGDPLSARHEADWLFAFRRASPDGSVWTARIESHAAMTADARAFRLHRRIRAEASDGPSIEREWTETVARGYL
ncbi:MAG: CocE/NonD family hydrolase, partial [Pseudomonadota bacterium]